MSLDVPTPPSTDETPDDSLAELREKLKEQRAAQRACLAKHKRTTFMAVEGARKATTYYDPAKLRAELALEDEEDEAEETDSPAE